MWGKVREQSMFTYKQVQKIVPPLGETMHRIGQDIDHLFAHYQDKLPEKRQIGRQPPPYDE